MCLFFFNMTYRTIVFSSPPSLSFLFFLYFIFDFRRFPPCLFLVAFRLPSFFSRRVGGEQQLAYSRDQSGRTRATRINDRQQDNDSFLATRAHAMNCVFDASSTPTRATMICAWMREYRRYIPDL